MRTATVVCVALALLATLCAAQRWTMTSEEEGDSLITRVKCLVDPNDPNAFASVQAALETAMCRRPDAVILVRNAEGFFEENLHVQNE